MGTISLPSSVAANDESLHELIEAIRILTPEEGGLFMQCGLEGLTSTRAAEIMHLSSPSKPARGHDD